MTDFRALKDLIILMQENQELYQLETSVLNQDVETLLRRSEARDVEQQVIKKYKPKSISFPPFNLSLNIQAFTTQVERELSQIEIPFVSKTNWRTLKSLQKDQAIIIKLADKGGNTVVMDVLQYSSMCKKILNNKDWYELSSVEEADSLSKYMFGVLNMTAAR